MEKKLQKLYPSYYSLLITQDLWQTHYKHRHDRKKLETCRIKYKHCDCFLEYTKNKDE